MLICYYRVTSIREDNVSLTTYLAAEPAPWSDVAGTYDLDFGHMVTRPEPLQQRSWRNGDLDETKTADLDLNFGHPHEKTAIWPDDAQVSLIPSNSIR